VLANTRIIKIEKGSFLPIIIINMSFASFFIPCGKRNFD